MIWNAVTGAVTFYIDGVAVLTATAAVLPAATTGLQPLYYVDDGGLAAVPIEYNIDLYRCISERR